MAGKGNALDAVLEFRRNNPIPHSMGNPYLINSGRLVELDPDSKCMEVFVYEGQTLVGKFFGMNSEIVAWNSSDRKTYSVTDGHLARRYRLRPASEGFVSVFAEQKTDSHTKWRSLGVSTRPGCILSVAEWEKVIEYARVEWEYDQECEKRQS